MPVFRSPSPRHPRRWCPVSAFHELEPRIALSHQAVLAIAHEQLPATVVARASTFDRVHAALRARGLGEVFRNLSYTSETGRKLRLDVYLPEGSAPAGGWPVVMAIHGGGWRRYSKDNYGPRAAALTGEGYAVVSPNYTLSAPGRPSWPDNMRDLWGALHWIGRNARQYGLDQNRIATMGESAGGHLALMLAVSRPDGQTGWSVPRVRAVVDFFGPTELTQLSNESPDAGTAVLGMLGVSPARAPELYRDASPADLITKDTPPVLILHGAQDPLVPVSQARVLKRALDANRVPNQLFIIPGAKHGFGFKVTRYDLLAATATFLDRALNA